MNILVLSHDYPDDRRSTFPFVKQLVDEFANQGHSIQVVAPYSLTHNKRFIKQKKIYFCGNGRVTVYRPYYLSFSNYTIAGYSPNHWFVRMAFDQGLKMLGEKPDIVYGHFWAIAYYGFDFAQEHNIPLFVATGESIINFRCDTFDKKKFCDYVSGVICVSSKNRDESVELGLVTKEKCVVIPNAVNNDLFKTLDKKKCRQKLDFPKDAFIIAFVGGFSERKGVKRVSEAVCRLDNKKTVFSIFIGDGSEEPDCPNILFKNRLPHEQIPEYLNAADAFVLPTLHEGCCNAVIEAMACGLPIVSSDRLFNRDVLDETNSILVDPLDINAIADAIRVLRDNRSMRDKLASGALLKAKTLTIDNRADAILKFIRNKIKPK